MQGNWHLNPWLYIEVLFKQLDNYYPSHPGIMVKKNSKPGDSCQFFHSNFSDQQSNLRV
jgi:hypothetical protein